MCAWPDNEDREDGGCCAVTGNRRWQRRAKSGAPDAAGVMPAAVHVSRFLVAATVIAPLPLPAAHAIVRHVTGDHGRGTRTIWDRPASTRGLSMAAGSLWAIALVLPLL